eukprot:scaffold158606_cov18-Tisochrysis_lutea.AAC.1
MSIAVSRSLPLSKWSYVLPDTLAVSQVHASQPLQAEDELQGEEVTDIKVRVVLQGMTFDCAQGLIHGLQAGEDS